jgi:HK97 family phage major capsid protein
MASLADANKLHEERAKLNAQINQIIDQAEKEERNLTTEERTNLDQMVNKHTEMKEREDRIVAAVLRQQELDAVADPHGLRNADAGVIPGTERFSNRGGAGLAHQQQAENHLLALQGWMMYGFRRQHITNAHVAAAKAVGLDFNLPEIYLNLGQVSRMPGQVYNTPRMQNNLSAALGSTGSVTIPEGFMPRFDVALLQYGGVLKTSEIIRTSTGEVLPWPTGNDTANKGKRINSGSSPAADPTTSAQPTFGAKRISSYTYSSDVIGVPFPLLRDNVINLADQLGDWLGTRIGRVQSDDFTTGTGGGMMPEGILTGAALGITAALANAIGWDEVIRLYHSIDPAYREDPSMGYMCHDSTVLSLRLIKDGQGRYLWQQSANAGMPDTLNGRPFTINQSMPGIATTNKSLLCGALSKYKVRMVNQVRLYRMTERYRDQDMDGFIAYMEADGALIDAGTHPVKYLQHP